MQVTYESDHCGYSAYISNYMNEMPHIHYQLELIYIIQGSLELTIHDKHRILKQDDMALIFPNQIHYGTDQKDLQILFFLFRPDYVSDIKKVLINKEIEEPYFSRSMLCGLSQRIITELIKLKRFDNIKTESGDLYRYNAYRGIILFLISDIISKSNLIPSDNQINISSVQLILDYIEEHYTEDLSLAVLSKDIGISRTQISRIFSNKIHLSFSEYINQRRLESAHNLIIKTDLNITEIMYQSGFKSERNFYRKFKTTYNQTPLQMRNSSILI